MDTFATPLGHDTCKGEEKTQYPLFFFPPHVMQLVIMRPFFHRSHNLSVFCCLKMHAIKPSPFKLSCKCFRFRKFGPQNLISADVSGRQERNLQPYIPSTRGAMLYYERCPICIQSPPQHAHYNNIICESSAKQVAPKL